MQYITDAQALGTYEITLHTSHCGSRFFFSLFFIVFLIYIYIYIIYTFKIL